MAPPRPTSDIMVERALLEVQRINAELARLTASNGDTTRHYDSLSEIEKDRLPLRQKLERRVRPGERLRPGETMCQKMGEFDLGGGSFAVMGA